MMLLKIICALGLLAAAARAECPLTADPVQIAHCGRHISSAFYGIAIKDLKIICSVASDIGNCISDKLGDCIAAEVGRAVFDEVRSIVSTCCPTRDNPRCPIHDSKLKEQRCFAADSLVTLSNGKQKPIAHLQPGDSLLAYDHQTQQLVPTPLLTMLDFQPHHFAVFKQVTTAGGQQLSLTSSHLLPTHEHDYVMAKNLRPGMKVYVMNEEGVFITDIIANITDVVKQGYVAPLTAQGTLIVNKVAASCYATINNHHVAHLVLAPMRWWYGLFGVSSTEESQTTIGVHWFPKLLYELTAYLLPSIIH